LRKQLLVVGKRGIVDILKWLFRIALSCIIINKNNNFAKQCHERCRVIVGTAARVVQHRNALGAEQPFTVIVSVRRRIGTITSLNAKSLND
jgi:hypothetical protein